MATVTRLNHAVLYVSDVDRSAAFYKQVFGFVEVDRMRTQAVFLRAAETKNHHDLAVMLAGAGAPPRGSVGLYHLAWEVATIDDLAEMARALSDAGVLAGASDHAVSKSLYAHDPDGIEFEVMFRVPREQWGEYEKRAVVMPLDLQREIDRFSSAKAS